MFDEKLSTLRVDQSVGDTVSEQIYLPDVVNRHNLNKIAVLDDPACKEVIASYNADKHKIGVTVTKMPQDRKECNLTVLVVSLGKSTITYQ